MFYLKLYEDWRSSGGIHNPSVKETPDFSERNDPEHKKKFLVDYDYTYNWVLKYHPKFEIDYEAMEDEDYEDIAKHTISYRIHDYMELYAKSRDNIKIERKVLVDDLSQINYDKIGVFWSFRKSDVTFSTKNYPYYEVKFYGVTDSKNVNWENGLDNFVYYGHDESEVKLFPGSNVTINDVRIIYRPNWNKIENIFTALLGKKLPFIVTA